VCFCKLNSSSTNRIQICSNTDTLFQFCSNECNNKFIISKKRTVSCSLCKVSLFYFYELFVVYKFIKLNIKYITNTILLNTYYLIEYSKNSDFTLFKYIF